jgi:hypothetical protein
MRSAADKAPSRPRTHKRKKLTLINEMFAVEYQMDHYLVTLLVRKAKFASYKNKKMRYLVKFPNL